jgi:formate C-acetyltransferase
VDSIGVEVGKAFIQETLKYRNPRGGSYVPGFFIWGQVHQGEFITATPDGRRAGESVSAHISPVPGTDKEGPIALLRSAVKICRLAPPLGTALDVKIHPSALIGESGLEKLMALIRGFMDMGGIHIQINVVDAKTLREAQIHPEKHRSLLVRVWGFSAYFIRLVPEYQEEIIARTEHLV